MKASPWEKEDAVHEGVEILNWLTPKTFAHEGGKLTGVTFEKVRPEKDERGRRQLVPTGEPDVLIPCDDVLIAVGQENAFPWIESDLGMTLNRDGLPARRSRHLCLQPARRVLRRRRGVRPQEHHHRGRAGPRSRDLDRRPGARGATPPTGRRR